MKKSLVQEFNETSAAARAAFPDRLERLVVLLVPTADTPVYVAPAVADQLTKNIAAVKQAVAHAAEVLHRYSAIGIANRYGHVGGTSVNLIALQDNLPGLFYKGYTREMWSVYVLDHELGHHVTPKGAGWGYSGQVKESSADAYAMLRHIQRFGKNTQFSVTHANRMAKEIVLRGDTAHYTTDTIQRVVQVAKEMDISKLSLRETAALAHKIAGEAHLDEGVLKKIRKAYHPVFLACEEQIGDISTVIDKLYERDKEAYKLFCRETLAVMREHADDADIYKAGKRFLSYAPVRNFMQKQAKNDAFYRDALGFLKEEPFEQSNMSANAGRPASGSQGHPHPAHKKFG